MPWVLGEYPRGLGDYPRGAREVRLFCAAEALLGEGVINDRPSFCPVRRTQFVLFSRSGLRGLRREGSIAIPHNHVSLPTSGHTMIGEGAWALALRQRCSGACRPRRLQRRITALPTVAAVGVRWKAASCPRLHLLSTLRRAAHLRGENNAGTPTAPAPTVPSPDHGAGSAGQSSAYFDGRRFPRGRTHSALSLPLKATPSDG